MSVDDSRNGKPLAELASARLIDTLFGRRSRRFGLGMEIPSGPLEFHSKPSPMPLSELERTALILCGAGVSGWATGLEHSDFDENPAGCNLALRLGGRTFPSAGATGATELMITDDSGTSITRFRDLEPNRPSGVSSPDGFARQIERYSPHIVRLSDRRAPIGTISTPGSLIEKWCFDRPGTTIFVPIIDLTQNMLNRFAILIASGAAIYDSARGRLCGSESIPRDSARRVTLAEIELQVIENAAGEAAIICHNIALACEAIGLGGWMFSADNPTDLALAFSADAIAGHGIRIEKDRSGEPNPVGIDACFETLGPAYVSDMRAAVDRFVDLKFGPGGAYDPYEYRGPYRNSWRVKVETGRYSPELIERLAGVAIYIHDTYGRFPATLPAVSLRTGIQVSHIDAAFYERSFGADSYLASHREHMRNWHDQAD